MTRKRLANATAQATANLLAKCSQNVAIKRTDQEIQDQNPNTSTRLDHRTDVSQRANFSTGRCGQPVEPTCEHCGHRTVAHRWWGCSVISCDCTQGFIWESEPR